jgi:3-dehydroquinate dehydratase-1
MMRGVVSVRGVELGGPIGRAPAVVVPLTAATREELRAQAAEVAALAPGTGPDIVEWRVDALTERWDADVLVALGRELVAALGGVPLLATVRTRLEGGSAEVDEVAPVLRALVDAGVADLVDVELGLGAELGSAALDELRDHVHEAGVPVVASWHDWTGTPSAARLHAWLDRAAAWGADVRKLAVTPSGPRDVLTLLTVTLDVVEAGGPPVIAIAMGPLGAASRLAGGVVGSAATFASLGRRSAPGQLPLADVRAALPLLHPGGRA